MALKIRAEYQALGGEPGQIVTYTQNFPYDVYLNNKGDSYPRYKPNYYGPSANSTFIPFPDLPFYDCPATAVGNFPNCPARPPFFITNSESGERRPNPERFHEKVKEYYETNGWPTPPRRPSNTTNARWYCAHHIHPVRWGGKSDGNNGVFVIDPMDTNQIQEHQMFDNWWHKDRFIPYNN